MPHVEPWIWLQYNETEAEDDLGLVRLDCDHKDGIAVFLHPKLQALIEYIDERVVKLERDA
jgi:hypothetical protein